MRILVFVKEGRVVWANRNKFIEYILECEDIEAQVKNGFYWMCYTVAEETEYGDWGCGLPMYQIEVLGRTKFKKAKQGMVVFFLIDMVKMWGIFVFNYVTDLFFPVWSLTEEWKGALGHYLIVKGPLWKVLLLKTKIRFGFKPKNFWFSRDRKVVFQIRRD